MHRLRAKKKGRGEDDDTPPPVPSLSKNFLKKSKPAPAPEPPAVDLQHALPSSDDFRTSLLMPNLANRFSILKAEQEALANANLFVAGPDIDGQVLDSIYSTARFRGLGDIAETSSLHGSIASAHDRLTSRSEERRPSEDGSIMNRGRVGEGNVLFGGRQKVYKVTASKGLRSGTSSMEDLQSSGFGRSVGQSDLPEAQYASQRSRGSRDDDAENRIEDLVEHNRNRYTASSTNSTPTTMTRSSTAATSINSQPGTSLPASSLPQSPTGNVVGNVAGNANKTRRPLYEQALDQQLQDHQSITMGRLERLASLRRLGTASPPRSGSPVAGSPQRSLSPSSPSSRAAMPWSNKKALPEALPPPAEEPEERRSPLERALPPPKPAEFDTFDFGLSRQQSTKPPPPLATSNADRFAMRGRRQGPFSPGLINGDRNRRRSPERAASPAPDRNVALGTRSTSPVGSIGTGAQSTFLASSSNSGRSSLNDDLVIQRAENKPYAGNNGSARGDSPTNALETMLQQSPFRDSFPESETSSSSRVSSLSDEPAKDFLAALKPLRNSHLSPLSPKFSSDIHSTDDDSPTLPGGPGLNLLVQQHLRSGSDASSMYAGSNYTRLSRVSRYGVAASITKYDDLDPDVSHDEHSGPNSPTSIYPLTPSRAPPMTLPPPIPTSPLEPRPQVPPKAAARSGSSTEDEEERGRKRTDSNSNAGAERGESSKPGTRAPSRTGTERSQSTAGERDRERDDDQDRDWEQQLAFRRQIVQQNLRNQEKIHSQYEMPFPEQPIPPSQARNNANLKAKGSNGVSRTDVGKSPVITRPDSRDRGRQHDGRMDGRHTPRGAPHGHHHHQGPPHPPGSWGTNNQPHPPGSRGTTGQPHPPGSRGNTSQPMPPQMPTGQLRPLKLQRPPLNTNHSFGQGSRSADPLSPSSGRSRNSPPQVRQRPSQEQLKKDPRGQPMGWNDSYESASQSRNQPTTPNPRQGSISKALPFLPAGPGAAAGYKDDLTRAMMTGQSNILEASPMQRPRNGSSPEKPLENVKSTFDDEDLRPPTFRRPRGNSLVGGGRQKSYHENAPLPPLNTSNLAPPSQMGTPSIANSQSPSTAGPSPSPMTAKSPAQALQQIASANSTLVPAKKRAVNKFQISEPTLMSMTSSIPTISLPSRAATDAKSAPSSATSSVPKMRKRNNTLFGGFGKHSPAAEEVPNLPSSTSEVNLDSRSRQGPGNKLRKSTSDGGALASRARIDESMAMRDQMPRMRVSPAMSKEIGGMI